MNSLQSNNGLRIVLAGPKTESLIIIVPDIGTTEPEHWHNRHEESWIKTLFQTTASNSRVLCFNHGLNSGEHFAWSDLLKKGETLLSALLELRKDHTITECPIQFLCFGLGGIITKDAVQIAHQQPHHFRVLLSVIAGFVFVGTPHSKSTNEKVWKTLSKLPKLKLRQSTKRSLGREDISRLANICERFEELEFDRPILSSYESRETPIGGTFRSKKVKVIGGGFCTIDTKDQAFLELDSDYLSICDISSMSTAFQTLSNFVRDAINGAQLRIMVHLNRRDSSIHPDRFTVRTKSIDSGEDSAQKDTGDGTAGSTTASIQIIPLVSDFTVARRMPHLPCYMHRNYSRNVKFFGRTDVLQKLEEALLPPIIKYFDDGTRELQTFSLCGLGGIGKTEIAVEFMFAHRSKFDAIFWLQADDTTKLREGFSQIAIQLNLEDAADAKDQVVSTGLVKGWLANPLKNPEVPSDSANEANWLLVFDNVDNPDDLNDFWPQFGRGSVLITSRDPFAKASVYSTASGIDLAPFGEMDAARFLIELTQSEEDFGTPVPEPALAVARKLGGLPLGLMQMAGIINRKDYTFNEFLRKYEEKSLPELLNLKVGWRPKGYAHTIASVWALDRLSEQSTMLLDVISLLDPDGIKETILTKGAPEVNLPAYPQTDEAYQDARADLTRRSLVTRNKKEQQLRVHRLTQDAVRAKMTADHLHSIFDGTVNLVSSAWPYATMSKRHHTARWDTCETLIPNIIRLHELYSSFILPTELFGTKLLFAQLLTDAAWYLHERGGGDKFILFLDLAQAVCESQTEDARYILSDIHYTRGAEAAETNQTQVAFANNTAFLKFRLEISETSREGQKDMKLAQAYNQAANAHMDRLMIDRAIELYGKAIDIFRSLDDYTETMTTICIANLGTALWLQQRYDDAFQILIDNLRDRERAFGVDDTESFRTGRLLHVIGNVRASQGHMGESFSFHHRALLQYRSTVGSNHHRTADLCCKVAQHYIRLGHYNPARSLLDQALHIYGNRSFFQPELARTCYLRGRLFALTGDETQASEAQTLALSIYRRLRLDDPRPIVEISEADFDDLVCFASK